MPNWSDNISAPLQGFIWEKLQSLLGMKIFLWLGTTRFTKGYISSLCLFGLFFCYALSEQWAVKWHLFTKRSSSDLLPMQQKLIIFTLLIKKILSWELQGFTGFGWPGIISRGLQRWLLGFCEKIPGVFSMLDRDNASCHWPRLRRSVTVVELVGYSI